MGNRVVFWMRRHSVARVNRAGDWFGMGYPVPVVTPFDGAVGGSLGEPHANGLREELERARAKPEPRRPGRPRKS